MWMPGDVLFAAVLLVVAFLNHEQRTAARIQRELDSRAWPSTNPQPEPQTEYDPSGLRMTLPRAEFD